MFRLLVGPGMGASVILGFARVRRGDIASHRAWMTRAYALALGAGTQVLTVGIGQAVFGTGVTRTDLMQGAGWAINLVAAEWAIRRSDPKPSLNLSTEARQRGEPLGDGRHDGGVPKGSYNFT